MSNLFYRAQMQFKGLCGDNKEYIYSQKGKYVQDNWFLAMVSAHNFNTKVPTYAKGQAGYKTPIFNATFEAGLRDKKEVGPGKTWVHPEKAVNQKYLSLFGHYNFMNDFQLAGRVEADPTNMRNCEAQSGLQYTLDKGTKMMAKLNNTLESTLHVSHKLNQNSTLMCTMTTNLKNLGSDYPARSGHMGYPFIYGLRLKYEA